MERQTGLFETQSPIALTNFYAATVLREEIESHLRAGRQQPEQYGPWGAALAFLDRNLRVSAEAQIHPQMALFAKGLPPVDTEFMVFQGVETALNFMSAAAAYLQYSGVPAGDIPGRVANSYSTFMNLAALSFSGIKNAQGGLLESVAGIPRGFKPTQVHLSEKGRPKVALVAEDTRAAFDADKMLMVRTGCPMAVSVQAFVDKPPAPEIRNNGVFEAVDWYAARLQQATDSLRQL